MCVETLLYAAAWQVFPLDPLRLLLRLGGYAAMGLACWLAARQIKSRGPAALPLVGLALVAAVAINGFEIALLRFRHHGLQPWYLDIWLCLLTAVIGTLVLLALNRQAGKAAGSAVSK